MENILKLINLGKRKNLSPSSPSTPTLPTSPISTSSNSIASTNALKLMQMSRASIAATLTKPKTSTPTSSSSPLPTSSSTSSSTPSPPEPISNEHHFSNTHSTKRKYSSIVRPLTNKPTNIKQTTHLDNINIAHALGLHCCLNPRCQRTNFTLHEVLEIRKAYHSHTSEKDKSQFLLSLFKSFHTINPLITSWKIEKNSFALVINNKPICPTAFQHIYGISFHKITQAAINAINPTLSPPPKPISTTSSSPTITSTVKDILQQYFDRAGTPATVNKKPVTFIHGFQKRKQLYTCFHQAQTTNTTNPLVCNYHTFTAIWRTHFPWTWLAGDTLCSLCYEYDNIITNYPKSDFGNNLIFESVYFLLIFF